jgi:hypothetical protein
VELGRGIVDGGSDVVIAFTLVAHKKPPVKKRRPCKNKGDEKVIAVPPWFIA